MSVFMSKTAIITTNNFEKCCKLMQTLRRMFGTLKYRIGNLRNQK